MRTNEQGRSMIEMLGVLAIVGVLSVGGIAGYSKAMNKFKTNKVIDQINMIATNVRTLYSSQPSYKGLENKIAIKTGLIPGEMYDASEADQTKITNAFGGEVNVKATNYMDDTGDGDLKAFTIAMGQVPQASCVSIATTEWGGDAGSGLVAMYVAGDNDLATGEAALAAVSTALEGEEEGPLSVSGADGAKGLPYSVVKAATQCANDENVIAWKYI